MSGNNISYFCFSFFCAVSSLRFFSSGSIGTLSLSLPSASAVNFPCRYFFSIILASRDSRLVSPKTSSDQKKANISMSRAYPIPNCESQHTDMIKTGITQSKTTVALFLFTYRQLPFGLRIKVYSL